MAEPSYPRDKIKFFLLEGINPTAESLIRSMGYTVERLPNSLSEEELLKIVGSIHVLGIRSRTNVTPAILSAAKNLLAIGCFCIGTNQVALDVSRSRGVPVFNAPFSNTRSVAELTVAEMVMLARRAAHKSQELHAGLWNKNSTGCNEVRGKVVGIIGYGNIGPQVGLLAEGLGMQVLFYDIAPKLALGNAKRTRSLGELLAESDFVTLHVPETPLTINMMNATTIAQMKKGAYLLNLSRGTVVDVNSLAAAIVSGHLAGAAVDVFPQEPSADGEPFDSPLRGLPNVILTPHIGAGTKEAQESIGREVGEALLSFMETGSTTGAVNFPAIDLASVQEDHHRILHIHRNVPGALRSVNAVIAERGVNIIAQRLATLHDIGYLIMDVAPGLTREVKGELDSLPETIRTRLLF